MTSQTEVAETVADLAEQVQALNDITQRLLIERSEQFSAGLQQELAELLIQLNEVDHLLHRPQRRLDPEGIPEIQALLKMVAMAVTSLHQQESPPTASQRLISTVRFNLRQRLRSLQHSRFALVRNLGDRFIHKASTPVKILAGLMIALPVYVFIPIGFVSALDNVEVRLSDLGILRDSYEARHEDTPTMYRGDFQEASLLLILCWVCGSTGSIVSILSRLSDYRQTETGDGSAIPILIGLFKPIIGGTFGTFIFALMVSGLIPIQIGNSSTTRTDLKWLTYMAAAFTAGFSERLSKDIMTKTEGALGASEQAEE
jgi:hypothetical protein